MKEGYKTYDTIDMFIHNMTSLQHEIENITALSYPILENTHNLLKNGEITIQKINQISTVANQTLYDLQYLIKLLEQIIHEPTYVPQSLTTSLSSQTDIFSPLYDNSYDEISKQMPYYIKNKTEHGNGNNKVINRSL